MNQSEAEAFLQNFHEARKLNDLDAISAFFAEDAEFSIAGEPRENSIAHHVQGREALQEVILKLVTDWKWIAVDFKTIVTSGDLLISRYDLTVHHAPSGREMTTEVVDFMEIRDGKVASMRQFVDTAHVSAVALGKG